MGLFAKKLSQDELRRQATEELESALARAKPPSESERTWVRPLPEMPDLGPPPRRAPGARRARLVWQDIDDGADDRAEDLADDVADVVEAPAPARRPATTQARATTRRKPPAKTAAPRPATVATTARRAPAKATKTTKTVKTAQTAKSATAKTGTRAKSPSASARASTTRAKRTP